MIFITINQEQIEDKIYLTGIYGIKFNGNTNPTLNLSFKRKLVFKDVGESEGKAKAEIEKTQEQLVDFKARIESFVMNQQLIFLSDQIDEIPIFLQALEDIKIPVEKIIPLCANLLDIIKKVNKHVVKFELDDLSKILNLEVHGIEKAKLIHNVFIQLRKYTRSNRESYYDSFKMMGDEQYLEDVRHANTFGISE